MAVRTVASVLLVLCVALIGEVIGGSGHRHHDKHDDDDSHDKDDRDGDDKGTSHVMIIGGFVCGAILVATGVVIITFCCLKKAKKPERIINPEKLKSIAVLGSGPSAYDLPHSKYIRPDTPRGPTAPGELFSVPAKGPAPVEAEKAVPGLDMPPPYPSSPPPAYTKQISVKDGGLYN